MPTTMALWQLNTDGTATRIPEEGLEAESLIEEAIESSPEILGHEVLVLGRQVPTGSGPLDLLGIDAAGDLVVIENKRDRTPRDVVAQVIDYAAWVRGLSFDEVSEIYAGYCRRTGHDSETDDLNQAYADAFGEELESLGEAPKMIIVAVRLDDSTERMIEFLADDFSVPINAALFQSFGGGLIGRTWLRPEEVGRRVGRSAARSASREEAKIFWDRWLPFGREQLSEITLPADGPRSVFIRRRIIAGVPANIGVWVTTTAAYPEVEFDDEDPEINARILEALEKRRPEIEASFDQELEWKGTDARKRMTRRTKIVAPKVSIGERAEPTEEGLRDLATRARELIDVVKPVLPAAYDEAAAKQDGSTSSEAGGE